MASPAARGYRRLLHHCAVAEMMIPDLPVPGGLLQAVRTRYREVVSSANADLPLHQRRNLAAKQRESLDRICAALLVCHENDAMVNIAKALSSGYGNAAYRSTLFRHLTETPEFDAECEARKEKGAEAVAERQNRLMLAAVMPYLERLCILSSPSLQASCLASGAAADGDADGATTTTTSHSTTHDNEMLRAMASPKAGVTVQVFPCDPHFVAVEIDEMLNKQTVFISCPPSSSADMTEAAERRRREEETETEEQEQTSGGRRGKKQDEDPGATPLAAGAGGSVYFHRVDTAQLETQRGTILHLEWMNSARRVLDTLLDESLIHRARGTVIVGHGQAGAVATALGLMMLAEQFVIRNVVTFGAPKVVEEVQDGKAEALNAIRVVMAGDPLVLLPVSGAQGRLFHHVGELLQVHSDAALEAFRRDEREMAAHRRRQAAATAAAAGKQGQEEEPAPVEEDPDAAENLFAMLNDEVPEGKTASASASSSSSATTSKASASADHEQREDPDHVGAGADDGAEEEGPAINFNEQQAVAAEEAALQWPFSVLAYRAALADPQAELEYFEEDAGIWERDDSREAFHKHENFEEFADDSAEKAGNKK